jgi:hypothetical protein
MRAKHSVHVVAVAVVVQPVASIVYVASKAKKVVINNHQQPKVNLDFIENKLESCKN